MNASTLSRRDFLRLAGITLVASQVPLPAWSAIGQPMHARALTAAPVYAAPSTESAIRRRLWPDSMVNVEVLRGAWYQLPDGYVPVESLQPMPAYIPEVNPPALPAGTPIAVSGPAASVREWCAADAPLVARVGHGGIGYVVDYLPDDHSGWYAVRDEGSDLLGWTPAVLWSAITPTVAPVVIHHLRVDRQTGAATVLAGEQPMLETHCAVGDDLSAGTYPLRRRVLSAHQAGWQAVPHLLETDAFRLYGAYWHNRFGVTHSGATIEFPTGVASTLYHLLDEKSQIIIL
jgi:hypothetical protein